MDSRSFEEEFERGALRSKAVDPHQRLALWTMVVWVVACLLTACPTAAGTIPLPRARPASIPREQSLPREATTEVSPCQLGLGDFGEFRPAPSITGPGDCTATDVVTLEAVRLPDRHRVVISPAVTLRCSMAEEFARWIRDDVAPTIAAVGASLTGVETVDSFDCRGFNGVGGARTSEHGHANALDIRAFKLTNGDVIQLNDAQAPSVSRASSSEEPSRLSHFRGMPPHTSRGPSSAARPRRPWKRPNQWWPASWSRPERVSRECPGEAHSTRRSHMAMAALLAIFEIRGIESAAARSRR
jgi:Extensin-like protein C-terminus